MCLFYLGNLCLDLLTNQLPQAMRTNPQEQAAPGGVPGGLLELRSKGRAHPVIPILVTSLALLLATSSSYHKDMKKIGCIKFMTIEYTSVVSLKFINN